MKWIALVVLAGLFAAGPFLSSRALGTSEAYNYSLAVADAVKQARAGEWPALVGQTEFAFNGRIHPVRTAPYLTAFASAIDLLTFRQLDFWTLQNLTLALSLLGGALTCYWAFRRVTPVDPETAAWLAAAYILSPGVLSTAYTMDLYMTVMTVPFIPLVLAANLVQFERRTFARLAGLAALLALCWLAHPPVAVWLCIATVVLQLTAFLTRRPALRDIPAVLGAAAVFLVLAGFGLASALTISTYGDITHVRDTTMMLGDIRRVFAGTVRPVSEQAGLLSDFQLGYFYFACAGLALVLGLRRRQWRSLALLGIAALYLALTTPVPGLTAWLWDHAPTLVINLTNQWPMQRLYLPVTALVLFAFALVWRPPLITSALLRDIRRALFVVAIGWTGWQSWHYINRGYAGRLSPATTAKTHLGSNLELTLISYAILGTPGDFSNGVMDPAFSLRLLAPYDLHETASNWTAPLPDSEENRRGTLVATAGDSPDVLDLAPGFTLRPGARYRLTFNFLVSPADALLQMRGPGLSRKNILPTSGGKRGFGMLAGHNRSLTVWTSRTTPEPVELRLVAAELASGPWRGRPFAGFTFERIDPAALPVELKSLLPLQARVRAPEAGYLETPRMFIDGYEAKVNGRPARVQPSPDGLLMLAVPAGASDVEVRYAGPRLVRWTLRLTLLGWTVMAGWALLRWGPARGREWAGRHLTTLRQRMRAAAAKVPRPAWLGAAGAMLLIIGAAWGWGQWSRYRDSAGPVRIRFVLPVGGINRRQPLLVTGRPNAALFVYAIYGDADHISLGFEAAGTEPFQTDPLRVDRYADHEITIEAGALYPEGHPALRRLPAETRARLRRHFRIELDGRTVVERELDTFASKIGDVTVGQNRLGGAACEPEFTGEILRVRREPVPIP